MTDVDAKICWVCGGVPHLCRCPVWGPAFHPDPIITPRDRRDMATWLQHKGIAPTPLTVDALIRFLRHLEGGEQHDLVQS